jgi:hypothetical protein
MRQITTRKHKMRRVGRENIKEAVQVYTKKKKRNNKLGVQKIYIYG